MASKPRRVVLMPTVTDEDVAFVAGLNDWSHVGSIGPNENSFERRWQTPDETYVTFVQDLNFQVQYLSIDGPSADTWEQFAHEKFSTLDLPRIVALSRQATSKPDRISALYYIGVAGSGEYDPGAGAVLREALADPDPDLRRAAIFAALYTGWPEIRPLLERARDHDDDSAVRELAAGALASLARTAWAGDGEEN